MNYLIYPTKKMLISQSYLDSYSHSICAMGNYVDYPIDETAGDSDRSYFYCPCDEIEIKRIYGVSNKGTNAIWLESTSEVVTPTFTDYITIMVIHPNDDTLGNLYVGQKFKRKEAMFLEGNDGDATGNHFHISVARGKMNGNGWIQNSNGCFVLISTKGSVKPEDAFYIDRSFTEIIDSKGIEFKNLFNVVGTPTYRDTNKKQIEILSDNLYCRDNPGVNSNIIGYTKKGIYNYTEAIDKDGYTWYLIDSDKWIAYNGESVIKYDEKEDIVGDGQQMDNNMEMETNEKESVFIFIMNQISKFIAFIKRIFKR